MWTLCTAFSPCLNCMFPGSSIVLVPRMDCCVQADGCNSDSRVLPDPVPASAVSEVQVQIPSVQQHTVLLEQGHTAPPSAVQTRLHAQVQSLAGIFSCCLLTFWTVSQCVLGTHLKSCFVYSLVWRGCCTTSQLQCCERLMLSYYFICTSGPLIDDMSTTSKHNSALHQSCSIYRCIEL